MKKKDISLALILILIGIYLIVSRLDIMPKIPVFTILFTVLFVYWAFRGFMRRHFFEGVVSLAIVGCINDDLLGIEAITPWTLMAAAVLIGIALDMIFRNKGIGNTLCNLFLALCALRKNFGKPDAKMMHRRFDASV